MDRYRLLICRFLLGVALFLGGCDVTEHPFESKIRKKEILVYCGMTMIQPVMQLAAIMEKEQGCIVKISYGGSEHLARSVEVNRTGEIFFPGMVSFISQLKEKGLLSESVVVVGSNEAALFVTKGNPHHVKADLYELLRPELRVVVGASKAGSIGQESKNILSRLAIYEKVLDKALYLTTDSKGLMMSLRQNEADVTINWRAVRYLDENHQYLEMIPLPAKQAQPRTLAMGILNCSKYPELGKLFLKLAASDRGRKIFKSYGF